MATLSKVNEQYSNLFGTAAMLLQSPGRINLIGEHTDYNLGCVLPAAIDKYIFMAIGTRADDAINLVSADFDDQYSASLDKLEPAWKLWPNYILGVINEFKNAGKYVGGINLVLGGDIPISAGMSSSAAICTGTAFALNKLFNAGFTKLELAKIAVAAEHNYLKVKCGLMDPYVNLYGKERSFVKLNCRTEEHQYVPFDNDQIKIVLFNSGVRHNFIKLASAFDTLREHCATGLALIQKHAPHISSLPEVPKAMLEILKPHDQDVYKRCLYIVEESERLERLCDDLMTGDFKSAGQRLFESHEGLRNLYQISCEECDFLVDTVKEIPGVLGARMMGAGFGGCTINLVESEAVDEVIKRVKGRYNGSFAKDVKVYHASIGSGTEEVSLVSVL